MKTVTKIFERDNHAWHIVARDPDKKEHLIDSNEYLIVSDGKGALLDPGGQDIFPAVFSALSKVLTVDNVQFIFSSHQDPDISSSIPLWHTFNPKIRCYVSWLWANFLPHFGGEKETFVSVPDEGMDVTLNKLKLRFIPAHYLHSSGNLHLYDPEARMYFSGDVGAAILPEGAKADIFVQDFDRHLPYMKAFHQRWMPSNEAKNDWIDRVSSFKIDMLCPQHGAILQGPDVAKFFQWLRELPVGIAIKAKK